MSQNRQDDILAVDLGGTHLRVARVDPRTAAIGARRLVETPDGGPAEVVACIARLIDRIASDIPVDQPIGMASPGPLDPLRGITHRLPNLPGFEDFPLADAVREACGRACYVHNDASLAALGESWAGNGRDADPLLYVTWSTGIGGGLVSRGEIVSGARGLAGEIGHLVVRDGGPTCALGHPGCAEALASGTGIAARAAERFGPRSKPENGKGGAENAAWSADLVLRRAADGDAGCEALVEEAARAFALALAGAINLLDPERVVIGGGVARNAWDQLIPRVLDYLPRLVLAWPERAIRLLPAGLGDDSGLVGAARHAAGCHARVA